MNCDKLFLNTSKLETACRFLIIPGAVRLDDTLFRKGCAQWKLGSGVTEVFAWPEVCAALGFGGVLSARISSLSASCKVTLDIEFHLSWWVSEQHVIAHPH